MVVHVNGTALLRTSEVFAISTVLMKKRLLISRRSSAVPSVAHACNWFVSHWYAIILRTSSETWLEDVDIFLVGPTQWPGPRKKIISTRLMFAGMSLCQVKISDVSQSPPKRRFEYLAMRYLCSRGKFLYHLAKI